MNIKDSAFEEAVEGAEHTAGADLLLRRRIIQAGIPYTTMRKELKKMLDISSVTEYN